MLSRLKRLLFNNTTPRQTVVKNTFWLFSGEFFSRLIRGAIVIYSASVLHAAEYGVFSYVLAVAGFIAIFSDFGISAILTRESVKHPEAQKEYFATALAIKAVFLLVNTGIILFAIPYITKLPGAIPLLPLIALMLVFDTVREFGYSLFRAHEKMEREALVDLFTNIAVCGLGFFALYVSATATALLLGYIAGSFLGFIAAIILLFPYFRDVTKYVRPALVRRIIALAWPIGLLGVLGSLMINTDMIMVAWFKNAETVGYYAAAQKPIQLLYIVPTLLASAVFPVFARLAKVNNVRFREVFEKCLVLTFGMAIPVVAVGSVLAPQLIQLLFPGGYEPAVPAFSLLLLTVVFVFPSALFSNALFSYNEQRQFLLFVFIGVVSNALLDYLLIPSYGIEGSAVATIISQLLTLALVWRTMAATNPFHIFGRLPRVVSASLLTAAVSYGLNLLALPVLLSLGVAIICYVGLLWLLREPIMREALTVLKS